MGRQVVIVANGEEAEVLEELLDRAGYRVVRARDLAEAQRELRRLVVPALVLVDDKPDLDLVQFLAALRRLRPADFHALPVVLLADGDRDGPLGVSEVVARPYLPPLLLEAVQRLLEQAT